MNGTIMLNVSGARPPAKQYLLLTLTIRGLWADLREVVPCMPEPLVGKKANVFFVSGMKRD